MTTVRYTDFSSYDDSEAVRRFTNHLRDEIAAMSRILTEYAVFEEDLVIDEIEERESPLENDDTETERDTTDSIDAQPGSVEFLRQAKQMRDDDDAQRREKVSESVGNYVFDAAEISETLGWSGQETREVLSTMVDEGILNTRDDGYAAAPSPDRETGYERFEYIVSDSREIYPEGKRGDGNGCSPFSLIDNPTVVDTTDYVSHVERSEFDDVSLGVPVPDSLKDSVVENLRLRRILDGTYLIEYAQLRETTSDTFSCDDVERMGWSGDRVSEVLRYLVELGCLAQDGTKYVWNSEPSRVVKGVSEDGTRDWLRSNSPGDTATGWLGWRY